MNAPNTPQQLAFMPNIVNHLGKVYAIELQKQIELCVSQQTAALREELEAVKKERDEWEQRYNQK